jgi:hypothetical protein
MNRTRIGFALCAMAGAALVLTVAATGGRVLPVDINGRTFQLDRSTYALEILNYEHHEIHAGSYFRAGHQVDLSGSAATNLVIVTPDSAAYVHMRPRVDVESEAEIALWEAPAVTSGSAVTIYNANRNSAGASACASVSGATLNTSAATLLMVQVLGSGRGTGGNATAAEEWVLKRNTKYALVVTNQTSSANEVNIRLDWYEHTDKE